MKVVVVDVQKGIVNEPGLYNFDGFVKNMTEVLALARANNVEVIHVHHDEGPGSGFTFGDEDFEFADWATPKAGEKVFVKSINSCFGSKEFTNYLEESGDKDLMIIGVQTDLCIDATVKSAFERGYNVILPKATNSTFANDYMDAETTYRYYNDRMWPDRFAKCVSLDAAKEMLA